MMPADRHPSAALTILVVEDDSDTHEFIVMLLSMVGFQGLEAASGAAGLTMIAGQLLQAILLDLRLLDVDGLTVCRRLHANGHPDLPLLLMTADRAPDVERRAQDAGAKALLAKPFFHEALIERIRLLTTQSSTPIPCCMSRSRKTCAEPAVQGAHPSPGLRDPVVPNLENATSV